MSLSTLPARSSWRGVPRALPRLLLAGLPFLGLLQAGPAEPIRPRLQARNQERQIRAGESHRICFDLAAGEFLNIVLEQKGIDLMVELFDPQGNKVQEMDSPDDWLWEEEIAWVAERSGTHRLVVHPYDRFSVPGAYRMRIERPRPPGPEDRVRMEALRFMRSATQAFNEGRQEDRLGHLEKALPLWRQLGEERRQAEILCQRGDALAVLGRHEQAVDHFLSSAELWKAIGIPDRRLWTFLLGWNSEVALGRVEQARNNLEEALGFARRKSLRELELRSNYNLGLLHQRHTYEPRVAAGHFEASLGIARELGDRKEQLFSTYELGYAYDTLAEKQDALRLFEEALKLAREVEHAGYQADSLNSMGFLYASLGQWEKAIERYEQALELTGLRQDANHAATLNNLAMMFEQRSIKKARNLYERSLALGRDLGNPEIQTAAMNNLAFLEIRAGNPALALERGREALPLASTNMSWETATRQAMGIAHRKLGDLPASRRELETALALSRERGDRVRESMDVLELARTERAAGNLRRSLELLEAGTLIVESLRAKVVEEKLKATFLASRQEIYELHTDTLMALHRAEPGRGYDAEALRSSERARARSLLDILSEAGADVRAGAAPGLIEQERRLQAEFEALEKRRLELLHGDESREAAEISDRLAAILDEHDRVKARLQVSSPRYAALTQPEPLSVPRIQSEVLDSQTLLLEYSLGEERSFLWAVTPDSLQSFELPSRATIEEAARRYYGALKVKPDDDKGGAARTEARKAADLLSGMLLGPVKQLLAEQTLLVVSDGALQYVPFGSLPIPSSAGSSTPVPLITRHEVVNLPSASVLAVLRHELASRKPAPKMLAVLANPVFQREDPRVSKALAEARKEARKKMSAAPAHRGAQEELRAGDVDPRNLQRLQFTEEEARAIAKLVPEAQRFMALGFAASRATATGGELVNYRMVHFATHGLIDSRRPELSSLVLSLVDEKGEPQNGFLRLHDIYNLKLNADLVVLSACQTALGQEIRGEGLMGLTRGFMYAGAARVLASLWSVDDQATSELMQRFYRHRISGKRSPAGALRQAQIEMSGDPRWASPYYWAGFSLQGEWR